MVHVCGNEGECNWFIVFCHMTKMVIPYMVKTFKNLRLWNEMADDVETWYAALITQILPNLFK